MPSVRLSYRRPQLNTLRLQGCQGGQRQRVMAEDVADPETIEAGLFSIDCQL